MLFRSHVAGGAIARFLPSDRPAGDMLRFAILGPGTYLLAAPR